MVLAIRFTVVAVLVPAAAVLLWRSGPGPQTVIFANVMPMLSAFSIAVMAGLWEPGRNNYASGLNLCVIAFGVLTRKPIHTLVGATTIGLFYPLLTLAVPGVPRAAIVPFIANCAFLEVAADGTIIVVVEDDGPGVPESLREKVLMACSRGRALVRDLNWRVDLTALSVFSGMRLTSRSTANWRAWKKPLGCGHYRPN